jgi:hypothetical protein
MPNWNKWTAEIAIPKARLCPPPRLATGAVAEWRVDTNEALPQQGTGGGQNVLLAEISVVQRSQHF